MTTPKKITIDVLAGMMNRSFEHLEKKMDEGFRSLRADIDILKVDMVEVKGQLKVTDNRLEKIESKVNLNNENRLSRIEDDVRIIKTKLEL